MQKIAFLFDNDGVLIDSSHFHWKAWQALIHEEPSLSMDETAFIKGFGKRNDLILKELVSDISEETSKRFAMRKEELFRQIAKDSITLLPGMEIFLKQVLQAKIPHIIASSTPRANLDMFLSSTVLGKYFDQSVSAEEVAHGKPYPDVFLAAASKLGFNPEDCIVFEDAPAGIEAANRAGCFVVALATTHTKEMLTQYDMLYPSAKELDLQEILNTFYSKRCDVTQ